MAINRLQSPYAIDPVSLPPSAYASAPLNSYVGEFISNGQIGTINGVSYRVHIFNIPASYTITFSSGGYIDVLILAAGGPGGSSSFASDGNSVYGGGGGGAGGLDIEYKVEVAATSYTLVVGSGAVSRAAGFNQVLSNGDNSSAFGYTAFGGGSGGTYLSTTTQKNGKNGGSGGGAAYNWATGAGTAGTGVSGQGNAGGVPGSGYTGGGGGYTSSGFNSAGSSVSGGLGGNGISVNFDGTIRPLAAGGGGGNYTANTWGAAGGLVDGVVTGGRGIGSFSQATVSNNISTQTPTAFGCGGGGGASYGNGTGCYGGDGSGGLIMIRYAV